MEPKWWDQNTNLAILLEYLHENGSTFDQCIQALRKPWNYEREYLQARR